MSEQLRIKIKSQFSPVHLFSHIVLLGVGLVLLYPLIFMVMAGFFNKTEFSGTVLGVFPIPKSPTLANYKALIMGSMDAAVTVYFRNSIIRTVYNTFWALTTSFLAGYVFARLKFKGKETLFLIMLATQMIPTTLAIIPTYLEFARFPFSGGNDVFTGGTGILNTWWIYLIGGRPLISWELFWSSNRLRKFRSSWMRPRGWMGLEPSD